MRYEVLGRLRVTRDDIDLTPAPPKIAKLLALLVVRAGEPLPGGRLLAELWEDRPPRCAVASLRVYISQLRKLLGAPGEESPIITAPRGYILAVGRDRIDAREFELLYRKGRSRFLAADFKAAFSLLREAQGLWRGPVLEGMSYSMDLTSFAAVAEEKRLNCTELGIDAALALGRHHEVIEELGGLLVQHPLREPFYRQLMIALYRAGRQGDALGVYRRAREVIRTELGVEPGPPLRSAQQAILRADVARLGVTGAVSFRG
nr:AfsR/SARP family transcriptional regulator [Streptomyces cupreus]